MPKPWGRGHGRKTLKFQEKASGVSGAVSKVSKQVFDNVESDDRHSLLNPFDMKTIDDQPNRHCATVFLGAKGTILARALIQQDSNRRSYA